MNALKPGLLMISAALLGACASAPPKSVTTSTPAKAVEIVAVSKPLPKLPDAYTQKGVAIKIDGLWQSPDGTILGVSGTAKNVTATDLRFCQVSLAFLDDNGTQIADAKVSTKSLKSAQIWHFQAGLDHPSSASYSAVQPDKTIAIPVRTPKAELASLK